jgi:hypothetical protein
MAATVVTFRQQLIQQSTNMLWGSSTSLKLEKNVFISSDITVNARRVDNDNARTIASLASSPPVVSGVAITAATMAPSSSMLTTSSLSAGMASRSASADDGAPPATCSSVHDVLLHKGGQQQRGQQQRRVGCGVSRVFLTVKGGRPPPPPPHCRPFTPTSTVVNSSPRGPPGLIVPAPGEVERWFPPREGVVGAVIQMRPLLLLVLCRLAHRRPRPPLPSFYPPVESGGDHINSDAPIPPPKLIVNSTANTGNNASTDTSGDEGGMRGVRMGLRMGFSSGHL